MLNSRRVTGAFLRICSGVLFLGLAAAGCGDDTCPEATRATAQSGEYQLTETYSGTSSTHPHLDQDLTLEVDREANRVIVRYERDGNAVVETYVISATTYVYP